MRSILLFISFLYISIIHNVSSSELSEGALAKKNKSNKKNLRKWYPIVRSMSWKPKPNGGR